MQNNDPEIYKCDLVGLNADRPFRFCHMIWASEYTSREKVPPADEPNASESHSVEVHLPACDDYVPSHQHEFYEIALIHSGTTLHTFNDTESRIGEGDVIIILPGQKHAYHEIRDLNKTNIYVQPEWLAEDLQVLWSETGLVRFLLAHTLFSFSQHEGLLVLHTTREEQAAWQRELHEVAEEARQPQPSLARYNGCFLKILAILNAAYLRVGYEVNLPFRPELWVAVREMELIITENLHFSVTEIAHRVGLSRRVFSEMFREATQHSVVDYFQERRIARAVPMLEDPSMTITDIAYRLGFSDAAYFTRVFKRIRGITPRSHRVDRVMLDRKKETVS